MTNPENMPILYRNCLDSLPQGAAQDAFLWATERPENDRMCYFATKFADEVAKLDQALWYSLGLGFKPFNAGLGHKIDLHAFILRRHCFWRFQAAKEAWI